MGELEAEMKPLLRLLAIVVVCAPALLFAKGPTTKITITHVGGGTTTTLIDPAVLKDFNVWDGPGTYSGPPGAMNAGSSGFIVDWKSGAVEPRAPGDNRYEVQFFVRIHGTGPEELAYTVFYDRDAKSGEGFVYLPGRGDPQFRLNVRSIVRGIEGRWFHANDAWQRAFAAAVQ